MAQRTDTGVVLFTRDLRVHDNPTLHAALAEHDRVVPLFVLDEAILRSDYPCPNRGAFMAESLADLRSSLRERGGTLVVRRGDVAAEVARVATEVDASAVHVSKDVSAYADRRQRRLAEVLEGDGRELHLHDETLFVVPPGQVTATGKDHMAVFTPYFRKWSRVARRTPYAAPRSVPVTRIAAGDLPTQADISAGDTSPDLLEGGEAAGRARMHRWIRQEAATYGDDHDALGRDRTSRLSSYLHFGCVSPLELVTKAAAAPDFVRQVAWRDFHHQVLASRPTATREDYRPRGDRWRRSPEELQAWKDGCTGFPVVDAGMRQLQREGWMHNRARLIVGHFLTKTLYLDWRLGAQHFVDLLIDGDTANNTMNWQWVAGTGTDSRFNRTYNVTAQAQRHDPRGDYVRRYVAELADVGGAAVHEPWHLPPEARDGYPDRIVDVAAGNERFLRARGKR